MYLPGATRVWIERCYRDRLPTIRAEAFAVAPAAQASTAAAIRHRRAVPRAAEAANSSIPTNQSSSTPADSNNPSDSAPRAAYNSSRFLAVHGYDASAVPEPAAGMRTPQLAIAGPAWAARYPDVKFHVVHVTPIVDLTSRDTRDYAVLVSQDGALDIDAYARAMHTTVALFAAAVLRIVRCTGLVKATVRMPTIGLGPKLAALGLMLGARRDRKRAQLCFADALRDAAPGLRAAGVKVEVYDYAGDVAPRRMRIAGVKVVRGVNVFEAAPKASTIYVSGWDEEGFIGGAGRRAASFESCMVAGTRAGLHLVNCCYLHNPCFVPELHDPARWVVI